MLTTVAFYHSKNFTSLAFITLNHFISFINSQVRYDPNNNKTVSCGNLREDGVDWCHRLGTGDDGASSLE